MLFMMAFCQVCFMNIRLTFNNLNISLHIYHNIYLSSAILCILKSMYLSAYLLTVHHPVYSIVYLSMSLSISCPPSRIFHCLSIYQSIYLLSTIPCIPLSLSIYQPMYFLSPILYISFSIYLPANLFSLPTYHVLIPTHPHDCHTPLLSNCLTELVIYISLPLKLPVYLLTINVLYSRVYPLMQLLYDDKNTLNMLVSVVSSGTWLNNTAALGSLLTAAIGSLRTSSDSRFGRN